MRYERAAHGGAMAAICALGAGAAFAQHAAAPVGIAQELGVLVSDYEYSESGMSLTAVKVGIDYSIAFTFREGWFVRGALRRAAGDADYRGSGSMRNVQDWYFENRWVVGRDLVFGRHTVSPHVGVGYRYLYNDLRGTTSTGAVGYRRESQYLTVPIGVSHGFSLPNRARVVTTIEYDRLIRGRQDTRLSDIEGYGRWTDVPDVVNHQHRGYGWRLSAAYRLDRWSISPYASLWRIKTSDTADIRVTTTLGTERWAVWEPANKTREIGLKAAYLF